MATWVLNDALPSYLELLDDAVAHAEQAMAIYLELGNEWATSSCLNTLASAAHTRGRFDDSIALYERAKAIDTAWNDSFGIAAAENNMGGVYRDMKDFATAAEHFRRANAIGEDFRFVDVQCATRANLAHCAYELGDPDGALEQAALGLEVARTADVAPRIADLTMIRGRILRQMGRFDEALADLEESMALAQRMDNALKTARLDWELGALAYERGDLDAARRHLDRAVEAGRAYDMPPLMWEPLFYLARVRRDTDDRDGAEQAYRESMEALESIHGGIGDADRALVGEARDMASHEVRLTRLLSDELQRPEAERRSELIHGWRAEIDSLRLRFHDFVGELRRDRPDLYARVEVEPVTFRQLQRTLRDDEAFVEPVVLPERVVIFVVRGGDVPLVYREVPVAEARMDDLVRRMRTALEHPDGDWELRGLRAAGGAATPKEDPSQPAQDLHSILVDPILGDLDGVSTVILSPSGRLRYIPFAALFDGELYLVDRFDLAVLTQAGTLSPRDPVSADAPLLALGDPDGSLPGAVQEVHRLEELCDATLLSATPSTGRRSS